MQIWQKQQSNCKCIQRCTYMSSEKKNKIRIDCLILYLTASPLGVRYRFWFCINLLPCLHKTSLQLVEKKMQFYINSDETKVTTWQLCKMFPVVMHFYSTFRVPPWVPWWLIPGSAHNPWEVRCGNELLKPSRYWRINTSHVVQFKAIPKK